MFTVILFISTFPLAFECFKSYFLKKYDFEALNDDSYDLRFASGGKVLAVIGKNRMYISSDI